MPSPAWYRSADAAKALCWYVNFLNGLSGKVPGTHCHQLSVRGRIMLTVLLSVRNAWTELLTKSAAYRHLDENLSQAAVIWRVSSTEARRHGEEIECAAREAHPRTLATAMARVSSCPIAALWRQLDGQPYVTRSR